MCDKNVNKIAVRWGEKFEISGAQVCAGADKSDRGSIERSKVKSPARIGWNIQGLLFRKGASRRIKAIGAEI